MKRRYNSTIEKKPSIVIHKGVRSSNSLQIKSTLSNNNRGQNLSSVSVTRHCRYLSGKTIITPTVEENIKPKKKLINNIKTDSIEPSISELQKNSAKSDSLFENSQRQWTHSSNSNQALVDNSIENTRENFNPLKTNSVRSIRIDRAKNNIPNIVKAPIDDHKNIKINDIQLQRRNHDNESERKSKRKHKRRCFGYKCCPCSRLCAIASVFASLLLAAVIAAIIVALLYKTKSTTLASIVTTRTTTTTVTTSITTSTASTSSTTSSTSTTQTTTLLVLSIGANDSLTGIWNTVAGSGSTLATPGIGTGNYVPAEGPPNAFDNNCNNKFLSFGVCALNPALSSLTCGLNTGFHLTLSGGAVAMKSLRYCTGNDVPNRDPITMTLEGSNQTGSTLLLGSSWTLIYNGSCGLDVDPGRNSLGQTVSFSYNVIAYLSYRILITSKRGSDFAVQYGEMSLFAG